MQGVLFVVFVSAPILIDSSMNSIAGVESVVITAFCIFRFASVSFYKVWQLIAFPTTMLRKMKCPVREKLTRQLGKYFYYC